MCCKNIKETLRRTKVEIFHCIISFPERVHEYVLTKTFINGDVLSAKMIFISVPRLAISMKLGIYSLIAYPKKKHIFKTRT